MRVIVMDTGSGGMNFMAEANKNTSVLFEFILLPFDTNSDPKELIKKKVMDVSSKYTNNANCIVLACHTASSCIFECLLKDTFRLNHIPIFEPLLPTCEFVNQKDYKNILVLCTPVTRRMKWHSRLLQPKQRNVEYLTFPGLADEIDDNSSPNVFKSLKRFEQKREFLKHCDCVILGCTHYNTIIDEISKLLRSDYHFTGKVLNSNKILLQYFKKHI